MRIGWLSDIHLDFLEPAAVLAFARGLAARRPRPRIAAPRRRGRDPAGAEAGPGGGRVVAVLFGQEALLARQP